MDLYPKDLSIEKELVSCKTCVHPGFSDVGCPTEECHDCSDYSNYYREGGEEVLTYSKEESFSHCGKEGPAELTTNGPLDQLRLLNEIIIWATETNTALQRMIEKADEILKEGK